MSTDQSPDTTEQHGEQAPDPPDPDDGAAEDDATGGADDDRSVAEYVQWVALGVLVLVAVVATFQLYFAASAAIETFVTRRYRPLFVAGFNLAVLLACGIGVSALVRRLT
ncbi:hypothetical protein [Haloarcula litorea]|uniref:hypothetical protein n=1 Tax=Haloarcula litorea TaxID=3032579 RepID=UPI0023E8BB42|nr:hypothetical protein [Halomicroarcula sp. GDY20]